MKGLLFLGALAPLAASAANTEAQGPLQKVVGLLKTMKKQVEKEMEQDQEIFDKLACWCDTNRKEKTAAVEEAQQTIERLKSQILEYTGKYAQLAAEIKKTKEELKSDEEALEEATSVREKEAAEFHKGETDSVTAIGQLKGAITVLSKHQSLTQESMKSIRDIVKFAAHRFPNSIEDSTAALTLLQGGEEARPYANQSSEIFGILQSMKETMEADLSDAQKAEAKAAADFEALRTAKKEEIAAGREMLEAKQEEYADTGIKNANAKRELKDTEDQLEADQAFLADLEERCAANNKEMEARVKTRTMEIQAINETVDILTSDDARDLANKTLALNQKSASATSFLQERIQVAISRAQRDKAANMLKRVASRHSNPQLSMLASTVQLDAFTKVKKAIDDMVAQLKVEQADEVKKKDFCNEEFHNTETDTTKANRKMEELQGKKDDLEQQIKEFTALIETLSSEIAAAQVEVQRASQDRNAQSKEFQTIVADQQATQAILDKAIARLDKFYNPKEESLVQQPAGLKEGGAKKNAGASGVIGMIMEIKADSKEAEMEAKKDEQNAQTAYEQFVRNSNALIAEKQQATVEAKENKAQADVELTETNEAIKATLTALEELAAYTAQLHAECDFVLKNFEVRQTARSEEIEALQQAKQILSGAQ